MDCDELGEKMGNEKWSLKDRMFQLKGILDLIDRNNKWSEGLFKETTKKTKKEIRGLSETERVIREAVHNFKEGDLEGVNMLLKQDPYLENLCRGKPIEVCDETARQMIFLRRKELDSLIFELQSKEEEYLQNQYKFEVLKLPPKFDLTKAPVVYRCQEIEAEIENIMTRQDAAIIIRDSYDKIRRLLKKDARCFDTILGALQMDTIVQCQCVIKAMELGQTAIEDDAALRDKYNKTNKELKEQQQDREDKLSLLKKRITKARNIHNKLQRSESATKLMFTGASTGKAPGNIYTNKLKTENDELQAILNNFKEQCQVVTPQEIFPRAERMEAKKYRLARQIRVNNLWLKTENIRKNHINSMNENLLLCITSEVKQCMDDRIRFENELIEIEKIHSELKEEEAQEARILTNIQLQLTHLQRLVEPIKIGAFKMEVLDSNLRVMDRRILRIGNEGAYTSQSSALNFLETALPTEVQEENEMQEERRPPPLMDVCQLLDVISAKIDIIKTQVGEMDERAARAAVSYHKDYMSSRALYHQTFLPRTTGVLEEDAGGVKAKLPTREEMKNKSKRLVKEIKDKPRGPVGPVLTIKKHSCY